MFTRSFLLFYAFSLFFGLALSYLLMSLPYQMVGWEYSAERARDAAERRQEGREWGAVIDAEMAARENEGRQLLASHKEQEASTSEEWQFVPEKSVIERNLYRAAGDQMVILGPLGIEELELNETYPTAKTLINIEAEVFPYTDRTQQISALMYHDGLRWWLEDLSGYVRQN